MPGGGPGALWKLKMTGLVSQAQEAARWPQRAAGALLCVPDTPSALPSAQASEHGAGSPLPLQNQLKEPTRVINECGLGICGRSFFLTPPPHLVLGEKTLSRVGT